jgi:hypothetical protein
MAKKETLQDTLAGVRRNRRDRFFAEGGSQVMWHGGLAHTIPNKKRQANKNACRKFSID